MLGTVTNLRKIGEDIGDEVDVHMRLLGDLDKNVDMTSDHLGATMQKATKLLERSSNGCLM
jgi:hypothetical protein